MIMSYAIYPAEVMHGTATCALAKASSLRALSIQPSEIVRMEGSTSRQGKAS